jgi:hypothetical protein
MSIKNDYEPFDYNAIFFGELEELTTEVIIRLVSEDLLSSVRMGNKLKKEGFYFNKATQTFVTKTKTLSK